MKKLILMLGGAALFLSACSSAEAELNEFYDAFTGSLSEEQGLGELNDQYNELEGKKASLQEDLNNADIEAINNISGELQSNTSERLDLLEEERGLIADSKEAFEKAHEKAEEISNEEYKKEADSLVAAMNARFEAHETMTDTYTEALEAEQALFEYLGEEEITQDAVDEHLNKIAEYSEPINEAAETFSAETEKINQLKGEIEQILENN
ncbi:Putative cell-wall binding lipoprotein [Jeotgalicoccus saudimassiliensis]|uniref:Putative cell-wall binding lipoprotein n=1 Tax=Jeotgalicoccus saudimassiliensis TaxID=1461582 RepID=A0A078LZC1_9STAP|nr:YkyA family protein [Jeotgalicoccus saudimassiliensis]CDZ99305.1 Putative cell-wall binding lipoprotein [Jeotgalicoccus saudimassiliensis]